MFCVVLEVVFVRDCDLPVRPVRNQAAVQLPVCCRPLSLVLLAQASSCSAAWCGPTRRCASLSTWRCPRRSTPRRASGPLTSLPLATPAFPSCLTGVLRFLHGQAITCAPNPPRHPLAASVPLPGEHMCPEDGYVCFRNSELISGRLGKVRVAMPRTCATRYIFIMIRV